MNQMQYLIYKRTCRHSAAFRKLERLSCLTWTSPLYMNSSRADMLAEEVPSRMTSTLGHSGAASNKSWKCLLHAARMILCALNVTPGIKIKKRHLPSVFHRLLKALLSRITQEKRKTNITLRTKPNGNIVIQHYSQALNTTCPKHLDNLSLVMN